MLSSISSLSWCVCKLVNSSRFELVWLFEMFLLVLGLSVILLDDCFGWFDWSIRRRLNSVGVCFAILDLLIGISWSILCAQCVLVFFGVVSLVSVLGLSVILLDDWFGLVWFGLVWFGLVGL